MATGSKILPKKTPVGCLPSKQISCTQETERGNHMGKIIVVCSRKKFIFKAELEFIVKIIVVCSRKEFVFKAELEFLSLGKLHF